VSYVREQNLYVYDLAAREERAITRGGGGPVSYGVAEFVAQEEMERYTGYWWAPDESRIAFTRVDESAVAEVERIEVLASGARVTRQRYPAAGARNAEVQLLIAPLGGGGGDAAVRADLGPDSDIYLARVDWFPDSRDLAVQRQSRDQKTLTLLALDAASGQARELLTERSETWVDLSDEFTFLPKSRQFVWASSRSGYRHLYLYDFEGRLLRPLTSGQWMVSNDLRERAIRGIDEAHGLLYFVANRETPIERHLYAASLLDPALPLRRVTQERGWHGISMSRDATMYLDTYSTPEQPPSYTLRATSGASVAELEPNRLDAGHPYFAYLAQHSPTEFGTLAAEDGQTLHYQIVKPRVLEPGRRYPVVIDVYGGPGVQNVRRAWGGPEEFFQQMLAQRGYVVFSLDNRGSGMRGVHFENVLYRQLGAVEVRDQVRGAEFLRTLPYVDPRRIGMFGWSYGGYLTLMCLMQSPSTFAAGIAGAPVTDWSLYDTHYTERYLGTPLQNAAGYAQSNVLTHAAGLSRPLLLLHGMADDNVLFANSTALMQRLQSLDKPFDLMTYPGAKHSLLRHADTGPHAYAQILRFLDAHLGSAAPGSRE
ncbi:MAG TPA: S9 family peptidase, partial [Steroidobacteraceae bacterium]